ncbi:MAG TPA: hypothetical protein VEW66_06775 [Thermomicrobiales bacterium]|nr:hypothetical protein [Thermomicrobiales bacterium]
MTESKTQMLINQGNPLKGEANWLIIGIEALVLIAIGLYMLIDKSGASDVILQLIGVVLLFMSLSLGWESLRGVGLRGPFDAFRAGLGVAIGAIATSGWWSETIQNEAIRLILGWGLVAYGGLHLAGLLINRDKMRIVGLVIAILTLVLGIVLLTSRDGNYESRVTLLGWISLVFGALLAGAACWLYLKDSNRPSAANLK